MKNTIVEPRIIKRQLFGEDSRYRLDLFLTRFDEIVWMVFDAEVLDENNQAKLIRLESTKSEALKGLEEQYLTVDGVYRGNERGYMSQVEVKPE